MESVSCSIIRTCPHPALSRGVGRRRRAGIAAFRRHGASPLRPEGTEDGKEGHFRCLLDWLPPPLLLRAFLYFNLLLEFLLYSSALYPAVCPSELHFTLN